VRGTWAFLLAIAACGGVGSDGRESLDQLDADAYARDVHPILEARCATLDCHGVDDRPLRLYAETGLRARDDLRDQPIERDELLANVRAIEAIDPGVAPLDGLVARKPLAAAEGGIWHEGGDIWSSREESQASCVLAWLAGTSDAPAAVEACRAAAEEVALPAETP
jgi:hypothetical protein